MDHRIITGVHKVFGVRRKLLGALKPPKQPVNSDKQPIAMEHDARKAQI